MLGAVGVDGDLAVAVGIEHGDAIGSLDATAALSALTVEHDDRLGACWDVVDFFVGVDGKDLRDFQGLRSWLEVHAKDNKQCGDGGESLTGVAADKAG